VFRPHDERRSAAVHPRGILDRGEEDLLFHVQMATHPCRELTEEGRRLRQISFIGSSFDGTPDGIQSPVVVLEIGL